MAIFYWMEMLLVIVSLAAFVFDWRRKKIAALICAGIALLLMILQCVYHCYERNFKYLVEHLFELLDIRVILLLFFILRNREKTNWIYVAIASAAAAIYAIPAIVLAYGLHIVLVALVTLMCYAIYIVGFIPDLVWGEQVVIKSKSKTKQYSDLEAYKRTMK